MKSIVALIILCFLIDNLIVKTEGRQRIVGGSAVGTTNYPFYAYPKGNYLCGATQVHDDIFVTSAHCGARVWASGLVVGGNDLGGTNGLGKSFPISQFVTHPNYNNMTRYNDIMLMKIDGSNPGPTVKWNADRSVPVTGQNITAIGYGATSEGGLASFVLQAVNLFTDNYSHCRSYFDVDDSLHICSLGDPGKDSCQGDSGGPLFLQGTNIQVGIISYGVGCARTGIPAVNTRISAYDAWIRSTICTISSNPPSTCIAKLSPSTKPPTRKPTRKPTQIPTRTPTRIPTRTPTRKPTRTPTRKPTQPPIKAPVSTMLSFSSSTTVSCISKMSKRRCTKSSDCCGPNPRCSGGRCR